MTPVEVLLVLLAVMVLLVCWVGLVNWMEARLSGVQHEEEAK